MKKTIETLHEELLKTDQEEILAILKIYQRNTKKSDLDMYRMINYYLGDYFLDKLDNKK